MKFSAALIAAVSAQNYDYGDVNRFGSMTVNTQYGSPSTGAGGLSQNLFPDISAQTGHGGNRRFCHTTGHQRAVWQWSSSNSGGYFAEGRNRMECIGQELYCFIEERAQFGQIIAITAGCEQMMNHPQVSFRDQVATVNQWWAAYQQTKNFNNAEAARGNTNLNTYYGLGGCLAVAAQNGSRAQEVKDKDGNSAGFVGTDSFDFDESKENNNFKYLGHQYEPALHALRANFGLNQCLRFPTNGGSRVNSAAAAPGELLRFGVSVCRACCIAQFTASNPSNNPAGFTDDLCNYPPDTDVNIASQTTNVNQELIPRFDMHHQASQLYQYGLTDGRDNNLFVHGGFTTSGPGIGRGCKHTGSGFSCLNQP